MALSNLAIKAIQSAKGSLNAKWHNKKQSEEIGVQSISELDNYHSESPLVRQIVNREIGRIARVVSKSKDKRIELLNAMSEIDELLSEDSISGTENPNDF